MPMQFHDCVIIDYILFEYSYVLPIKPIFSWYWCCGCYFAHRHMICAISVKMFPFLHLALSKTETCSQVRDIFEE